MQSMSAQVLQIVATLLTVPPMTAVAAINVRTEPISPIDVDTSTALNLELGPESPPERIVIGLKDRNVDLIITGIATGANAFANVDALIVEAHARLMLDPSFGGLIFDLNELNTQREKSLSGQRIAIVEKTYSINFRTTEASLSN